MFEPAKFLSGGTIYMQSCDVDILLAVTLGDRLFITHDKVGIVAYLPLNFSRRYTFFSLS